MLAMKTIPLTRGKEALVDDEDYEYLSQWNWHCLSNGYAARRDLGARKDERKYIRMHRLINKTPEGLFTDHINGNKLDNRKSNLRNCTYTENNVSKPPTILNKSGYKGVSFSKVMNKWHAQIAKSGQHWELGYYDDPREAAKAYNKKVIELYGEFAWTNKL